MVKNINCNLLIRWNFISPYEFLNFFFFYSQIKSWNLYNVSYFHLQKLYTCSAYIYPVVIFFSCFFLLLIFCISFLRKYKFILPSFATISFPWCIFYRCNFFFLIYLSRFLSWITFTKGRHLSMSQFYWNSTYQNVSCAHTSGEKYRLRKITGQVIFHRCIKN